MNVVRLVHILLHLQPMDHTGRGTECVRGLQKHWLNVPEQKVTSKMQQLETCTYAILKGPTPTFQQYKKVEYTLTLYVAPHAWGTSLSLPSQVSCACVEAQEWRAYYTTKHLESPRIFVCMGAWYYTIYSFIKKNKKWYYKATIELCANKKSPLRIFLTCVQIDEHGFDKCGNIGLQCTGCRCSMCLVKGEECIQIAACILYGNNCIEIL